MTTAMLSKRPPVPFTTLRGLPKAAPLLTSGTVFAELLRSHRTAAPKPPPKLKRPPVAVETTRRREVLRSPATDFSHLLYHARRAATVLPLPEPTTANDFKTELGATPATEAAALALSKKILAAGARAATPYGTGTPPPTGLAAQIIAAGQKRRELNT